MTKQLYKANSWKTIWITANHSWHDLHCCREGRHI